MSHAQRFINIAKFFDRKKRDEEALYADFLKFYEAIVRATPVSAVQHFGTMPVWALEAGKKSEFGLVLTPTDYSFWQSKISKYGVRFVGGPDAVRLDMMNRMSEISEQLAMTIEERGALLDLIQSSGDAQ